MRTRVAAAVLLVAAPVVVALVVVALAGCDGSSGEERVASLPRVRVTSVPTTTAPAGVGAQCLTPQERPNTVRFSSRNGAELTAAVFGEGRRGIVLAHQSPGDLCDWAPYARELAKTGYQALSLDLNGNGGSTPSRGTPSDAQFDLDVAAAVGVLRGRGVEKIVLIGASLGGAAVVKAAAEVEPPVAGVISLSAPATTSGVDALAAARELDVPALFMAAENDPVAAQAAEEMHDAAPKQHARLEIYPGVSHGTALLNREVEPKAQEIRALVAQFIGDHTA